MTSRERVIKTLTFDSPDRVPRHLWALPGVTQHRTEEFRALLAKYPGDIGAPPFRYGKSLRAKGTPHEIGENTDDWGSVWNVAERGVVGEVKRPALADWSDLATYQPPWELLDGADLSMVAPACERSDQFMLAGTGVRPFERMQFVRGTENLFMDLMWQPKELFTLRDMIHEHHLRELRMWAETPVDAISFMDDWGTQNALLISPDLWREFYKPMYAEYCEIIRKSGKFVFMHSDGYIRDIYPDLIEVGVNAQNSQLFCMDIEELAASFKGQITFWGEICRQHILPFGTTAQVRAAVRRVRAALDDGKGGVIAQCEWGVKDPMENIATVFETWME